MTLSQRRREDGLICQWQPSAAYRLSTLGGGDRGGSGGLTYAQHLDSIDEHQATKMYKVRRAAASAPTDSADRKQRRAPPMCYVAGAWLRACPRVAPAAATLRSQL